MLSLIPILDLDKDACIDASKVSLMKDVQIEQTEPLDNRFGRFNRLPLMIFCMACTYRMLKVRLLMCSAHVILVLYADGYVSRYPKLNSAAPGLGREIHGLR